MAVSSNFRGIENPQFRDLTFPL